MGEIIVLAEYREQKRLERERGRNALRQLLFPELAEVGHPEITHQRPSC